MEMSKVTNITINGKEINKITDNLGRTLWEKDIPEKHLNDYSWTELKAIAEDISTNGENSRYYEEFYNYGLNAETKTLDLGTELIDFRIVSMLHDDKADGSGKAGLVFMNTHSFSFGVSPDSYAKTQNWRDSGMRTNMQSGNIYQMIDPELKSVVTPVLKPSVIGWRSGSYNASIENNTETFYAPSYIEIAEKWQSHSGYSVENPPKNEGKRFLFYDNHIYKGLNPKWDSAGTGNYFIGIKRDGVNWVKANAQYYNSVNEAKKAMPNEYKHLVAWTPDYKTYEAFAWGRSVTPDLAGTVKSGAYFGSNDYVATEFNDYIVGFAYGETYGFQMGIIICFDL